MMTFKGRAVPVDRMQEVAERVFDEAVLLHWNRRWYCLFGTVFKANTRLQEMGRHVRQWIRENYVAGALWRSDGS